jgi:regulatory protein
VPRDAEAWLAERGVPREAVVARAPDDAPPPGAAEVQDLARQTLRDRAAAPAPVRDRAPAGSAASDGPPEVEDDAPAAAGGVPGALAFIQRSTANAPQSEGRLRGKLRDRGHPDDEVEAALALARDRGLVDDAALMAALIVERRGRGHAEPRLRRDLRGRGFDGAAIDAALARNRDTDPLAAAFGLAREQAARHRSAPPEAAVRRIVAFLVRRGHGEAVARKAALDAVHADREPLRSAER